MNQTRSRALLFDIGGVVIDVDFRRTLLHWESYSANLSSHDLEQFEFDSEFEKYERGELSTYEHFSHLREVRRLSA